MDQTLIHSLMDWVMSSPEGSRNNMRYACNYSDTLLETLLTNIVPPLVRTLLQQTKEMAHVMSLSDHEYKDHYAMSEHPHWKGRGKDHKGQLYKIRKCEETKLLLGWSLQTHSWVPVIPVSVQARVFQWLDHFYNNYGNKFTRDKYMAYLDAINRNYQSTKNQRAHERGLFNLQHRRGLKGRRNHMVNVPKFTH